MRASSSSWFPGAGGLWGGTAAQAGEPCHRFAPDVPKALGLPGNVCPAWHWDGHCTCPRYNSPEGLLHRVVTAVG